MSNKQKWTTVIIPTIIFVLSGLFTQGQNTLWIKDFEDVDGDGLDDRMTLVSGVPYIINTPNLENWMEPGMTSQSVMSSNKSGIRFNLPQTKGEHRLGFRYTSSHVLQVIVTTMNNLRYVIALLPATNTPELIMIEYYIPQKQKRVEISTKGNNISWMIIDDILADPIGYSGIILHFTPQLIDEEILINDYDILGRRKAR